MRFEFVLDDETLTQGIFIEKGLNVTVDLFVFVCWHRVFIMLPGTETKHSLPTPAINFHEFVNFCFPGTMSNKTLGAFAKACKHLDFRFENGVRSRFEDRVTFSHPNVLAMGSGKWAGKGT